MNHQSNTQYGPVRVLAAEDLTAKEGCLVVIDSDGEAALPAAVGDYALHVLVDGAVASESVGILPLSADRQIRVRLSGTCSCGDALHLATPDGTVDGMATVQSAAGDYFSPGVALEDGADGQLVLVRPWPRIATVSA
jgi:hypothetical protein